MKHYLAIQNGYQESELKHIATILKNGGLVLFPTETVYGIGTNGLNSYAVQKIYEAKKRDLKNPINLLISDMAMIEKITQQISPIEYKLMHAFFPGPFTIILKRKKIIPDIVTANSDYVGIRIPNNDIAKKLINLAGIPIAAPSANISGKPSGTNFDTIIKDFSDVLDFAIDAGDSPIGLESTIVKVINDIPHILRPGSITPEEIQNIAGNVILTETTTNFLPSSTMIHYQLNTKSFLVYHKNNQTMMDKIVDISKSYQNCLVLCCQENTTYYSSFPNIKHVIAIASKNDLHAYSKNLFSALQKACSFSSDVILMEGVENKGLGIAIMNRLQNACNHSYIL